jgi:hypothetical protein
MRTRSGFVLALIALNVCFAFENRPADAGRLACSELRSACWRPPGGQRPDATTASRRQECRADIASQSFHGTVQS